MKLYFYKLFKNIRKNKFLLYTSTILLLCLIIIPIYSASAYAGETPVNFILKWVFSPILSVFTFFLSLLLDLITKILTVLMSATNIREIPAVTATWKVVRDGVNIFFIAILLSVGILNIINYENDSNALTAYMPSFVIAVIGVNFSKLICYFILDFVNVLTASIYTYLGGAGDASSTSTLGMYGQNIGEVVKGLIRYDKYADVSTYFHGSIGQITGTGISTSDWTVQVPVQQLVSLVILYFLVYGFLKLTGAYLARLLQLWILIASSPLFFMGISTKYLKQISDGWWQSFWKYAQMPIPVAAYLSIGMLLAIKVSTGDDYLLASGGYVEAGALEKASFDVSSNGIRYFLVVALVIGTLYNAFQKASDGGLGDKLGGAFQKVPSLIGNGLTAFGNISQKVPGVGKYLGGAIRTVGLPFRIKQNAEALYKAASSEASRAAEMNSTEGMRRMLSGVNTKNFRFGLSSGLGLGSKEGKMNLSGGFQWAKNSEKAAYQELVEKNATIHKGKTGPALDKALNATTNKAEQQAIIKVLADEQGVSIATLLTGDSYKKFRSNIGFNKNKYDDDAEAYKAFKGNLNITFPYQFAETITSSAHKLRDQQLEDGKMITKDMEELNIQTKEAIYSMAKEQMDLGNPFKAVGFLVSQVGDSNLQSDEVLELIYDLNKETGGVDNNVMTSAGRAGQRDGIGEISMLRRFNDTDFKNLMEETEVNSGKDFAKLMYSIYNNDEIQFKSDGSRTYNSESGANEIFYNNLDVTMQAAYNRADFDENDKENFMNAVQSGKAFTNQKGTFTLTEEDSKKIKSKTMTSIKGKNMTKVYKSLERMKAAIAWARQNNRLENPASKQKFADLISKMRISRNLDASQLEKILKTNGTDGSRLAEFAEYMPVLEAMLLDTGEKVLKVSTAQGRDSFNFESTERKEQTKRAFTIITSEEESYKTGGPTRQSKMNKEAAGTIANLERIYKQLRKNNSRLTEFNSLMNDGKTMSQMSTSHQALILPAIMRELGKEMDSVAPLIASRVGAMT